MAVRLKSDVESISSQVRSHQKDVANLPENRCHQNVTGPLVVLSGCGTDEAIRLWQYKITSSSTRPARQAYLKEHSVP
jgi:hypothetical protein